VTSGRDELRRLLDHLEENLRPQALEESASVSRQALQWNSVLRLPLVLSYPFPRHLLFQPFPHGSIFVDPAKHLYNELVYAFETSIALNLELGSDLALSVRPNFGIGLVSSILGARVEQIGDNPPWVRPFGSRAELMRMFDRDPTKVLPAGWMPRVVQTYQFYAEALSPYPRLSRHVKVVLPDLQGPFDNYALLRGAEAFTDFYTDPSLLQDGLALAAGVQVAAAQALLQFATDHEEGFSLQHGVTIKGNILLRNDSSVMLSPEFYREAIAPHDGAVIAALGGGGIHSCGNVGHQMRNYLEVGGLCCIDLGQGLMNDRKALYRLAAPRKVALVRMEVTEEELTSGSVLEMFPTGVSLLHRCESFEQARLIRDAYRRAAERGGPVPGDTTRVSERRDEDL
jgi:hypothetical protein